VVAGCDAGLKFDDPEHRPISDGGADLASSFVFAIFGEMDWQIIGRPDELPRHIWPATRDVGSHVINPDYGLAMSVVARHHTADVDCHSAPPCLLRKHDLLSGLKLWQGYGTAGASAILLETIASWEMYRQSEGEQTMLGHLGVNVQHLAQAKAYYDSLMPLLDFEPYLTAADQFAYRPADGKPGTYLFFYPALEGEGYSRHRPGLQHLAFMVKSRAAVHTVHAKVQELGSLVIHPPQEFPQYHPGYYAMFWQDPEGFMLEVVCHRDRG
jgi:catechol 2,3-dioxygenase-like lactoylglutathione lyase family enzyme